MPGGMHILKFNISVPSEPENHFRTLFWTQLGYYTPPQSLPIGDPIPISSLNNAEKRNIAAGDD